ncbi:hypothetical protein C2L65_39490 [Paraburkholderia terrae]|uniref:Uncharacterized protein n=1 Tax=Paraburkholderia terrae TaxID=311230 RepID=A0A2I8F3F2_9BURK|nr:hypothetical protein C2L65_39490 [Paraburkholderia terrae]
MAGGPLTSVSRLDESTRRVGELISLCLAVGEGRRRQPAVIVFFGFDDSDEKASLKIFML